MELATTLTKLERKLKSVYEEALGDTTERLSLYACSRR